MTTNNDTDGPAPLPAAEDSRETCFRQGKPCVYGAPDDPCVIVTEWPNGTIDRDDLTVRTTTRRWPDGRVETLPLQAAPAFPVWPRPAA